MIESIVIKQVASFDETGIQVNTLKKINFIYGANATGKTTISNLIANPTDSTFNNCAVNWKHDQPLRALVYNKHFRDSNFGGNNKLQGVFTLGQATKDDVALIEQKKIKLTNLKDEVNKQKDTLKTQQDKITEKETDFKEACWSFYKKYETDFKEAFVGFLKKDSFKNKFLSEAENNTSALLTIEEIRNKSKTIFGDAPIFISLLKTIHFDRLTEIENDLIWKKKIIGKSDVDIAKLIQNLNMNDWVNQGRDYLQEDGTCPFCQQKTITIEFKKKLEDYFDESFTEAIQLIKDNNNEYNLLATNLNNELSQLEANEKANLSTKLDVDKFTAYLKTLSSQFISNKELLKTKTKEPSRTLDLMSTKEQLENIEKVISDANEEIKKHNNIVTNFQTERSNLIRAIWKFVTEEAKVTVSTYTDSVKGLVKGIENIKKQIKEKETKYDLLVPCNAYNFG